MKYKLAEEKDIYAVTSLRMLYLREAYGGLGEDDELMIREANYRYLDRCLNRTCFIAYAQEGDILCSCAYLSIMEKAANLRFPDGVFGDLYGVYTLPEYRNHGLATELIKLLVGVGERLQLPFIQLDASQDGYALYKKIGFTETASDYTGMIYRYDDTRVKISEIGNL